MMGLVFCIDFTLLLCYDENAKPIEYRYKGHFSFYRDFCIFFVHAYTMDLIKMQIPSL